MWRTAAGKRATRKIFSAFCERRPAAFNLSTVLSSTSALRRLKRSTICRTDFVVVGAKARPALRCFRVQFGALASPDLVAFRRNGTHALVQVTLLEIGHHQRVEGAENRQRHKHRHDQRRIGDLGCQSSLISVRS